jgi:hypothetical protein
MGLLLGADAEPYHASREVRHRVKLPEPLLRWELAHMRERVATIGRLQAALSKGAYAEAAELAEQNLGMSSFAVHRAREVVKYMPHGMREMETELHRAASSFALEAANAGASGDIRPAIAALSEVMQRCVDCHTVYRFR